MSFLRFYNFSRLNYLLALILVLPLVACSGGDGGISGTDSTDSTDSTDGSGSKVLNLSWVAPSAREDDSALSLSEIASYRIYYGTESGDYQNKLDVNDSSAVQAQISGIGSGTYFVALTTVDTDGRESSFSTEVVVTV